MVKGVDQGVQFSRRGHTKVYVTGEGGGREGGREEDREGVREGWGELLRNTEELRVNVHSVDGVLGVHEEVLRWGGKGGGGVGLMVEVNLNRKYAFFLLLLCFFSTLTTDNIAMERLYKKQ